MSNKQISKLLFYISFIIFKFFICLFYRLLHQSSRTKRYFVTCARFLKCYGKYVSKIKQLLKRKRYVVELEKSKRKFNDHFKRKIPSFLLEVDQNHHLAL